MASIDKTYVNKAEWKEAVQFYNETVEQQFKDMGEDIYLYYDEAPDLDEFVLWNTSQIQDIWLWKNCQLPFVRNRLKVQYDESFLETFANLIDFSHPDATIVLIKDEHLEFDLPLFKELSDTESLAFDSSDEILVYGSTNYLETLDKVLNCDYMDASNLYFIVCFFGANLTYDKGQWKDDNGNILNEIPRLQNHWNIPKINHSFDSTDVLRYEIDKIFISTEKGIHPITDYTNLPSDPAAISKWIKAGRFEIPNYIYKFIR